MDIQKRQKKYFMNSKANTLFIPSPLSTYHFFDIPFYQHFRLGTEQKKKTRKERKTIQNATKPTKKNQPKKQQKQLTNKNTPPPFLSLELLTKTQNYQKTQSSPFLEYEEGFARRLKLCSAPFAKKVRRGLS